MNLRVNAALVVALVGLLGGCGGGDEGIGEESLQDCLADTGLSSKPPAGGNSSFAPLYLSEAPDFTAYAADGTQVFAIIQGSDQKAERLAADVRSAMQPLGIADPDERIVSGQNAVVVFDGRPSSADRDAAASCLD